MRLSTPVRMATSVACEAMVRAHKAFPVNVLSRYIKVNGCGETENYPSPSVLKSEVRKYLRERGWQNFPGDLDYCPSCVQNGTAKRRDTSMGLSD